MWILLVWAVMAPGQYQPHSVLQMLSQEDCVRWSNQINGGQIRASTPLKTECMFSTVLGTNS